MFEGCSIQFDPFERLASGVWTGSWDDQGSLVGMLQWGSSSDHRAKPGQSPMGRTAQEGFPNYPDNRESSTEISSVSG